MKPHSLIGLSIVGCEAESQTLSPLPSPTHIISCWPSYMPVLSGLISAAAEILATHLDDVTARRVHTARDDSLTCRLYYPLCIHTATACTPVGAAA